MTSQNNIPDENQPLAVFPIHERTLCCIVPCERPVSVYVTLDYNVHVNFGALGEQQQIMVPLCQFHYNKAWNENEKDLANSLSKEKK